MNHDVFPSRSFGFFLAEVRGSNNKRKSSLGNAFKFLTKKIFLRATQPKMMRFSLKWGLRESF